MRTILASPRLPAMARLVAPAALAIRSGVLELARRYISHRVFIALAFAVMVSATPALAGPSDCEDAGSSEKKQGKFHIEYVNGKPVTVIDTVVAVCGKVPRPSVIVLTTAKNLEYEWENLKQDFMPLIVASVKKAPF